MSSVTISPQNAFNTTHFFDKTPLTIIAEKLPHKITISLVPQQDNKTAAIWQLTINNTLLKLDDELFTLQGTQKITFEKIHSKKIRLITETDNLHERFLIWWSGNIHSRFAVYREKS